MPLALILCILASRTAVPVLAATSCPDYLVNRTRCNPVNDIVGPSAPTCQDDPDFYIENLGWWFLKQTQLNPTPFAPKQIIIVSLFVEIFGFLGQQILPCTSTFAIFPVSFDAWDEGLFSTGFSNNLCFQECFGVGFWMWTSSRDAWWKIGTSCQPGGGLQFFLWKLYYYKYLKPTSEGFHIEQRSIRKPFVLSIFFTLVKCPIPPHKWFSRSRKQRGFVWGSRCP